MLSDYLPLLVQIVIIVGFTAVTLALSVVAGQIGKRTGVKDSAYECGMLPVGDGQARFSVKFYVVAMLFVLFDIEVVYLYPWAVSYRGWIAEHGSGIFWSMLGFVSILAVAYFYALKKGALRWDKLIPGA